MPIMVDAKSCLKNNSNKKELSEFTKASFVSEHSNFDPSKMRHLFRELPSCCRAGSTRTTATNHPSSWLVGGNRWDVDFYLKNLQNKIWTDFINFFSLPAFGICKRATTARSADRFSSSCFSYSCFTEFGFTLSVQVDRKGSTNWSKPTKRNLLNKIINLDFSTHVAIRQQDIGEPSERSSSMSAF